MSQLKIVIMTGIAMFAMFFGSGNLVFPLKLGMESGSGYPITSLGLLITGVIVPFLGLFSMFIYQGDRKEYFGLLGKWAPFVLTAITLMLIGPFGVIPRCIIVAYGGVNLLFPHLPFALFSGIFSLFILLLVWQENKIVPIIGTWLGPVKIGSIVLIIVVALSQRADIAETCQSSYKLFVSGLVEGYQTMDLLASFFFSITIIQYLFTVCKTPKEAVRISLLSSLVGGGLIAIIYLGFVLLGAHYAKHLTSLPIEQYFPAIAHLTLGKYGTLIIAITMALACLTTAVTLTKLFADFVRVDLAQKRISWHVSGAITAAISFLFSLTGFSTIAHILGTILEFLYPALIVLAISAIIQKTYGFKVTKLFFWFTVAISALMKCL